MPRAVSFPIRFALVLSVLIAPACFSLPKVDVVRVVDNFADDAGLEPIWDAFDLWTCGAYLGRDHVSDAGQDGGLIGDVDAGQAVNCSLGIGSPDPNQMPPPAPGTVPHALVASFNLTAPYDVDVATPTKSVLTDGGAVQMPVNLTAFSQLLFDAKLSSTPPGTAPLPIGTLLQVELRCSSTDKEHPLVDNNISLMPEAPPWKQFALPFIDFTGTSKRQNCLATIDGIGFVVLLGSNAQAGTHVAGTLQLGNIVLK